MNKSIACCSVGISALALFAAPLGAQFEFADNSANLLFTDTFRNYEDGAIPPAEGAKWLQSFHTGSGTAGVVSVLPDLSNDYFNYGPGGKYLQLTSANNFTLISQNFSGSEVVTLGFDFMSTVNTGDGSRWLNAQIRSGASRAHITSPRVPAGHIRTTNPSLDSQGNEGPVNPVYGNDIPFRFDTVMNNSASAISYDTPGGGTATLASGFASVWLYNYAADEWTNILPEYTYEKNNAIGALIDNIYFLVDSNAALRSFIMGDIFVFEGASVGAIPEPSTYALLIGGLALLAAAGLRRRRG